MNVAAGPELAAAVTNAGGLGVIGGHGYTPKVLRQQVRIAARVWLTWSFKCNAAASDPSHQEGLE
jgi:NAD(P)H-dependent flavin oxidoreductase YrpB (nitropropane dioxygenase family)